MRPRFQASCVLLVVMVLVAACTPAQAPMPAAPGIVARAASFEPLDMSQSALLANLTEWERAVLDKLHRAADLMDAAYWQQVDPVGEGLFRSLEGATDPTQAAERLMLQANYGRWDRFNEFAPFLGDQPRPPGGYIYPRI